LHAVVLPTRFSPVYGMVHLDIRSHCHLLDASQCTPLPVSILLPPTLIPLPACCGHGSATCYTAPAFHRQLSSQQLPSSPSTNTQLTNTFLALQMRHARLRTLPSACTTSGANSIPNLSLVSHLDTDIKYPRVTYMCCTANTTLFANRPSRSTRPPNDSSTSSGAISGSRSKQFWMTGNNACSTAR
jgi:hypothetical protein